MDGKEVAVGLGLIRSVCHDVAGPLSLILLGLDGEKAPRLGQKGISLARKGARQQKFYLNRLRGLSLLMQGHGQDGVDVVAACQAACRDAGPLARQKMVTVDEAFLCENSFIKGLSSFVVSSLLVGELIQNAAHFAPTGSKVGIKVFKREDGRLCLTVQNALSQEAKGFLWAYAKEPLEDVMENKPKKGLLLARYAAQHLSNHLDLAFSFSGFRSKEQEENVTATLSFS